MLPKKGCKYLEYNLTANRFTKVLKEALKQELTSNGYSVKFDEYFNLGGAYCHFILLEWN